MAGPWEAYQPQSGPWEAFQQPAFDPTEGMSTFDKVAAGAGKSVHDLGLGLGQILGLVDQKTIDAAHATDAPLMNTTAGKAGNVLGQVGTAVAVPGAGAAGIIGKLAQAAAVNGGLSALQPVSGNESRLQNTLIGAGLGAAGQGVASGIGKMVAPAVAGSAGADAASSVGPLSYGQLSGNELAQRVEGFLAKLPGSRGWYSRLSDAQKDVVNQKIGQLTMNGQGGPALGVAGQGKNFISDPQFVSDLQGLPDQFKMLTGGLAPTNALKTAAGYVGAGADMPTQAMIGGRMVDISRNPILQSLYAKAQGQGPLLPEGATIPMNGPQGDFNNYQAIRSMLGKQAFGAQAGTPDAAAYSAMRDAFDSAGVRSLESQGADPTALATARNAYQVQGLLRPAEILDAQGNVTYNPQRASQLIDQAWKEGRLKNLPDDTQQQLLSLSAYGKQTKPVNSSGTAENQMGRDIATGAIVGNALESGGDLSKAFGTLGKVAIPLYMAPWLVNKGLQGLGTGFETPSAIGVPLSQLVTNLPPALTRQ